MTDEIDSHRRRALLQSLGALGVLGTGGIASGADENDGPPASRPPFEDDSSPGFPKSLRSERLGPNTVKLKWGFAFENPQNAPSSGLNRYEVFLDGSQVGTADPAGGFNNTFTLTDLDPERAYRASVRAVDNARYTGPLATVLIPPATTETFTHDCSTLNPLSEHSDRDTVRVDTSNPQYFRTPEGNNDEGRIVRSSASDTAAVAYELPGMINTLSVEFHKHTDAGGWMDVYESVDGGESWSRVRTGFEPYGEVDENWIHHEITASSFADGADMVRLVLTGGSKAWSGQLGHVEIDYFSDTIAPEPPSQNRPGRPTATGLRIDWSSQRRDEDLDHYVVYVDDKQYAEVPAGQTHATIETLDSGQTYEIGVSAVDGDGNESARLTEEYELLVDDCSDLQTTAFGTDTDRLRIDRSNPQYFERPNGNVDNGRVTRTDTSDADLAYEIPQAVFGLTVEFHRHEEYGGELLIDGEPTREHSDGSVEQYGRNNGWIHERHTITSNLNRTVLTITGGSKPWAGQIGHVAASNRPFDETEAAPEPSTVSATPLSTSSAEVTWRTDSYAWYAALHADGEKRAIYAGHQPKAVLNGLSPGTHEIGVSVFSETHQESEIVTTTVELPETSAETFVHDCTDLQALSSDSGLENLRVDTSNAQYFERPDGSTDGGRIARSGTTEAVGAVYSIPGDVQSLTAEFHAHEQQGGSIEIYESTDGSVTKSRVETTASTYGDTDGGWIHHEITADSFSDGVREVAVVLTGGSKPWSGQLGRVAVDYASDPTAPVPVDDIRLFSDFNARKLDLSWELSSRPDDLDHFLVTVDGETYAEVPPETTELTIDGLEPDTRYTVGVTVVDTAGNESEPTTIEETTNGAVIDDCSDLQTTAFDTDTDQLTIDRSNPEYFQRPDGGSDEARITRTSTDDATLVYKVPGNPEYLTIEFHRHVEHGGELRIDEQPIHAHARGRIRRYGRNDGWIHERYELKWPENLSTITITGGSRAWGSQIGRIEYSYSGRASSGPSDLEDIHVGRLSESAVQLTWQVGGGGTHAYTAISVDGEKVDEYRRLDKQKDVLGTVLTGLSPGTHEIGLKSVSTEFEESELVTRTVELPAEPVGTFEHDCADFDAVSDLAPWYALNFDESNPANFERSDGSTDDGRFIRSTVYNPGEVVYATPKPVAAATAEFHKHTEQDGWVDIYESTDGGDTWAYLESTASTYGSTDQNWVHHELTATEISTESTHLKFELTGADDEPAWSPQLGHVEIEYGRLKPTRESDRSGS